jgi:hypothetical protein
MADKLCCHDELLHAFARKATADSSPDAIPFRRENENEDDH